MLASRKPRPRGFTLIEVMVVVAIIVILAGIGVMVAAQVKRDAARKNTNSTLTTVANLMGEYLKNHPDPGARWPEALSADPETASKVAGLFKSGTKTILDGYGNPINFVPATIDPLTKAVLKPAYFRSDGLDGIANTADDMYSSSVAP